MADSKNYVFQNCQFSIFFFGSVGEIDVKGINVTQLIRSSGCPTYGLKLAVFFAGAVFTILKSSTSILDRPCMMGFSGLSIIVDFVSKILKILKIELTKT